MQASTSTGTGAPTPIALAERADVHKSCKALEIVVNSLNDFCRASEALALCQKKLAKALKEVATMKVTGELAVNALTLVSGLLESFSEAETRFVKVADKECEGVSGELKKWFKKLAKEEKAHDERIAASNTKIRQAGQAYEKKVKRKDRDAVEEHARYVNLLNSVGPEMSQENHAHALFVSQKHNAALLSVAATIARTAEAEWLLACEYVRRAAPVIGPIGESRAFLEGGWTSPIPSSRDLEVPSEPRPGDITKNASTSSEGDSRPHGPGLNQTPNLMTPPVTTPTDSSPNSSQPGSRNTSNGVSRPNGNGISHPPTSFNPPVAPFASTENANSVRSIESLSSFPEPPNHFPLPTLRPNDPSTNSANDTMHPSTSGVRVDTSAKLTESPRSIHNRLGPETPNTSLPVRDVGKPIELPETSPITVPQTSLATNLTSPAEQQREDRNNDSDTIKGISNTLTVDKANTRATTTPANNESEVFVVSPRRPGGPARVERTESLTSSGSIVASMRTKWDNNNTRSSPMSSPPREREIPRLSNKVTDLASRYAAADSSSPPMSPRTAERYQGFSQGSMNVHNNRDLSPSHLERHGPSFNEANEQSGSSTSLPYAQERSLQQPRSSSITPDNVDYARRRERYLELEELELREREREIGLRAIELERDRARLFNVRSATALTASLSQANLAPTQRPFPHYSYSATNLLPGNNTPDFRNGPDAYSPRSDKLLSKLSTPVAPPLKTRSTDHAEFCGCYTCSVLQYRTPAPAPQPHDMRPPEPPPSHLRPEKPRGSWMRRLSMPVVSAAFSNSSGSGSGPAVDSKKGVKNVVNMVVPSEDGVLVRRSFECDASGGISNVAPRPRKLSFGRRH